LLDTSKTKLKGYFNKKIDLMIAEIETVEKIKEKININPSIQLKDISGNIEEDPHNGSLDRYSEERSSELYKTNELVINQEFVKGSSKSPKLENNSDVALMVILTNKKYLFLVAGFIIVVGNAYIVFQASIVDTSSLGLPTIQISGIALGGAEL